MAAEWADMTNEEFFKWIEAQLGDHWYCTLISMREQVGMQLADKRLPDAGPRHYEYGATFDEAMANAIAFTHRCTCDDWYNAKWGHR